MRLALRSIAALVVFSPALFIPACGSSSNGGSPGGDAGSPTVDGSVPQTPDATVNQGDAGVTQDGGGTDDTGTGVAPGDAGLDATSLGDAGILGDNCPAFDAAGFVEGPHGQLPTMAYLGSGVLEAPQIITFTFATTPGIPTLQSFGATVTQSPWFAEVTKDYCIPGGACITAGPTGLSVEMTVAAAPLYVDMFGQGTATTGVDLDTFMAEQISAAVAAHTIPTPGPNSLYAFYFPPASSISFGPPAAGGGASCTAFGGYHDAFTMADGGAPLAYAILPDCPTGNAATDLQFVTLAASHEIAEATTDPHPNTGWSLDLYNGEDAGPTAAQIRNEPWANVDSFGEVGDNCESLLLDTWNLDSGVQVQRIWSKSAAAEGHNPCVPVPAGEAYYNTSTDKALYVVDVGSSFTIDVTAFSDIPRSSWRLDAIDYTPSSTQYLKLEFVGEVDGGDGISHLLCTNNKSTAQLKVTLLADPAADSALTQVEWWPEADGVIFSADVDAWFNAPLEDGGTYQAFPYQERPFAVVTPAIAASIGVGDGGVVEARRLAAMRGGRHASEPARGLRPAGMIRPPIPR